MSKKAYVQFMQRIQSKVDELKLKSEDKAGWIVIVGPDSGHRIAIQKSSTKLPVVETTLEPERLGELAQQLPEPNGRMAARLAGDPEVVLQVLPLLADKDAVIRPRRGSAGRERGADLDELLAAERSQKSE